MKPRLRIFIPTLLPALLAATVALSSSAVRADSTVAVPSMHISNLEPAAGKYINIFFVQATEALLVTTTGQQLEFKEIMMPPIREQIPANGVVDIPAAKVPKRFVNGLTKTYTHVFVAVTEAQPNPLYLRNEDGPKRPVIDPRIGAEALSKLPDADFQTVNTGFISKFAFPGHTQGNVIVIDAMKDLSQ